MRKKNREKKNRVVSLKKSGENKFFLKKIDFFFGQLKKSITFTRFIKK